MQAQAQSQSQSQPQSEVQPQPPRLPSELTIYTVADLRRDWLAADGVAGTAADTAARDCPVDASAVDQVDAAGVQLLLSLARTLADQCRPLRLLRTSATLQHACRQLGVSAALPGSDPDGGAAGPQR